MSKPLADLTSLLDAPLFWGFFSVVAVGIGVSGKFSVSATQILFGVAFVLALVGLRSQPLLVSIGGSAIVAGALILLAYYFRPDAIPAFAGTLIPKSTVLFGRDADATQRKLEIGDSGTVIIYAGPVDAPMMVLPNQSHLKIELIDGRVKVSTDLRDMNGNLVAELVRNNWKVAPPPQIWDRNYSDSALEVRGPNGDIVLQVQALSDRIRLQGEWHEMNGSGVRLVSRGPGKGAAMQFLVPDTPPNPSPIVPIFVYPSEGHLGERAR